jgi:hypothetical protein
MNFSTHPWLVKWNTLGYTFVLRILFQLLQCRCNTCTNTINNDIIHFISSHDHIGSSILTSLAFHHCFGPLEPSHHSTCPSHLQPICRAKSCLDLLHLSHYWYWIRTWRNSREIIRKRTDIGEHFTRGISPEYRICFIRKEKTCDD